MSALTQSRAWRALASHARALREVHLNDLFAGDDSRAESFSAEAAGLFLDYSKQRLTRETRDLLLGLAEQQEMEGWIARLFAGEPINHTEQRAAYHMALRAPREAVMAVAGHDVMPEVHAVLDRMTTFADALRSGRWKGAKRRAITDVVNIGIGGSDLGPRMVADALQDVADGPRTHFVSNVDGAQIHGILSSLDPSTTLFIVVSKTFTTQETMTNAASARRWLQDAGIEGAAQSPHLVAITAAPQKSGAAGYPAEHTFTFWDWVGGRYSLWSALGLPLAIAIGSKAFREFLAGGQAMDAHFRSAPLDKNLPVILAMSGVWNRNFLLCPTQLLSTYPSRLVRFAPFVQQMDMESNGKRIRKDGQPCNTDTGPIIWGGLGIDGQHAYFQLLHQGTHRVPVEFVGVLNEDTPLPLAAEHHRVVNLNLRAQAQALAVGRDEASTLQALMAEGMSAEQAEVFVSQRSFRGDVPSSTIWLDALTPHSLGALIALYEHKVFTQAAIWGINAYDQWGVELGKTMAKQMETPRGASHLPPAGGNA